MGSVEECGEFFFGELVENFFGGLGDMFTDFYNFRVFFFGFLPGFFRVKTQQKKITLFLPASFSGVVLAVFVQKINVVFCCYSRTSIDA